VKYGNEESERDFITENRRAVRISGTRPRSAATRGDLSCPAELPLSKVAKVLHSLMQRHARLQGSGEAKDGVKLDVSNFRIGADGAELVGKFAVAEGARELVLFNCAVGDMGTTRLAEQLAENAAELVLETVSLGACCISPKGMIRVSEWLRFDLCVASLDLQLNKIGDAGARLLAKALPHNRALRAVNLQASLSPYTPTPTGLRSPIEAGHMIKAVCAQGNLISAEGAAVLAAAVAAVAAENARLEALLLGFNPLGDEAVVALTTLGRRNGGRSLRTLDLCKTELSQDGADLLLHHVQRFMPPAVCIHRLISFCAPCIAGTDTRQHCCWWEQRGVLLCAA